MTVAIIDLPDGVTKILHRDSHRIVLQFQTAKGLDDFNRGLNEAQKSEGQRYQESLERNPELVGLGDSPEPSRAE